MGSIHLEINKHKLVGGDRKASQMPCPKVSLNIWCDIHDHVEMGGGRLTMHIRLMYKPIRRQEIDS